MVTNEGNRRQNLLGIAWVM